MRVERIPRFNTIIVGGGITGPALLWILSKFSNIDSIALVEKNRGLGEVNTHFSNNSQTLHQGDIETNYSLDKASKVKRETDLLITYLERHAPECFVRHGKMVLGVGEKETGFLEERMTAFHNLFPQLQRIEASEIGRREPKVMEGRNHRERVLALATEGYTVNFQALAQSFARSAFHEKKDIQMYMGKPITSVVYKDGWFQLAIGNEHAGEIIRGRTVVFAAGPYSLWFAKSLGYGKEYEILPVAGSFYTVPRKGLLRGKVYTVQHPKLPMAAIHGDPEINDATTTRFGPTAKVLPVMERHRIDTVPDFLRTIVWSVKGFMSFYDIVKDPVLHRYMLRNLAYDIPVVGKRLFLAQAQKIVPTLSYSDLQYARGMGGIRPQIVNTLTQSLEMGDAQIVGKNVLFDVTPSPGASICLGNAKRDAQKVVEFLGGSARFDEEKWQEEFGRKVVV